MKNKEEPGRYWDVVEVVVCRVAPRYLTWSSTIWVIWTSLYDLFNELQVSQDVGDSLGTFVVSRTMKKSLLEFLRVVQRHCDRSGSVWVVESHFGQLNTSLNRYAWFTSFRSWHVCEVWGPVKTLFYVVPDGCTDFSEYRFAAPSLKTFQSWQYWRLNLGRRAYINFPRSIWRWWGFNTDSESIVKQGPGRMTLLRVDSRVGAPSLTIFRSYDMLKINSRCHYVQF